MCSSLIPSDYLWSLTTFLLEGLSSGVLLELMLTRCVCFNAIGPYLEFDDFLLEELSSGCIGVGGNWTFEKGCVCSLYGSAMVLR